MPNSLLMSFSLRTMNGALVAICSLALAATPALAQTKNPDREAYFGETHVHTSWSLDAWLIGNRLTDPGDAYKYFKGEPIKHPLGYEVKIDTPLDWAGVTDHSEYVGVIKLANDPASPISKLPAAQPLIIKSDKPRRRSAANLRVRRQGSDGRAAGQGADVPGGRRHGLEGEHRARRQGEPAGEVHGLLLLRMDRDAEQHEPPPQHLLQGLHQGAAAAVQRAGLAPSGGPLELDGRPAEGRQRPARHLAQRQPLGRPHVPDRGRLQGPPDRCGLCRVARSQRAVDRDQADSRAPRKRIRCFRPTTSSRASSSCRSCWATRRAAFRTSSAASRGRR